MKKLLIIGGIVLAVILLGVLAFGGGEDNNNNQNGNSDIVSSESNINNLGNYQVEIKSCRLADDYEGKKVVIVNYGFTNNGEKSQSFNIAFDDKVYQNDIGLNEAYVLADSANYSADNQSKEIKKGATLDVEVAYTLNDTTTDIVIEVEELISFNNKKVTKTFSIK